MSIFDQNIIFWVQLRPGLTPFFYLLTINFIYSAMFTILVESRSRLHCFFKITASDVSELRSRLADVLRVFNLDDVQVMFYPSSSSCNKSKSDSK